MDAIEFVSHYQSYLALLEKVVKPEYIPSLQVLRESDPHDLIAPEHYFNSGAEAMGIVFQMFLKQVSKDQDSIKNK
jgi:hypothetical protein